MKIHKIADNFKKNITFQFAKYSNKQNEKILFK
jgi:hypothetical protein